MNESLTIILSELNLNFQTLIYIALFLFALILIRLKPFKLNHRNNIKQSKKILKSLREFDGEYKTARQFSYLRKIDPFVFEELLLTCFEERGIKIKRSPRYTGDGGQDGEIWLNGKKILIQAKRYKSHINSNHVSAFTGLVSAKKVRGLFIHTGKTGYAAKQALNRDKIEILSGQKLIKLIIGEPLWLFGESLNAIQRELA